MTAVVADAVHRDVVDDSLVVDVNVGDGDVVHGAVVIEVAVAPVSAFIAVAEIAEAVIHASVETDVRPPISRMPDVDTVTPTPVAGRPEYANRGWSHPGAGNPVVAFGAVGPVTGRPDVHITRAGGLLINRQHGGGDLH